MAEAVMIALVSKGLGRQEAHQVVRDVALEARDKGLHLREVLLRHPRLRGKFTAKEADAVMDPARYTGSAGAIVDRVLKVVS